MLDRLDRGQVPDGDQGYIIFAPQLSHHAGKALDEIFIDRFTVQDTVFFFGDKCLDVIQFLVGQHILADLHIGLAADEHTIFDRGAAAAAGFGNKADALPGAAGEGIHNRTGLIYIRAIGRRKCAGKAEYGIFKLFERRILERSKIQIGGHAVAEVSAHFCAANTNGGSRVLQNRNRSGFDRLAGAVVGDLDRRGQRVADLEIARHREGVGAIGVGIQGRREVDLIISVQLRLFIHIAGARFGERGEFFIELDRYFDARCVRAFDLQLVDDGIAGHDGCVLRLKRDILDNGVDRLASCRSRAARCLRRRALLVRRVGVGRLLVIRLGLLRRLFCGLLRRGLRGVDQAGAAAGRAFDRLGDRAGAAAGIAGGCRALDLRRAAAGFAGLGNADGHRAGAAAVLTGDAVLQLAGAAAGRAGLLGIDQNLARAATGRAVHQLGLRKLAAAGRAGLIFGHRARAAAGAARDLVVRGILALRHCGNAEHIHGQAECSQQNEKTIAFFLHSISLVFL